MRPLRLLSLVFLTACPELSHKLLVKVDVVGDGEVSVAVGSSTPRSLDCDVGEQQEYGWERRCTTTYEQVDGEDVTLTADPYDTARFVSWGLDCSDHGAALEASVTMDEILEFDESPREAELHCRAEFVQRARTPVHVTVSGPGVVTSSGLDPSIECRSDGDQCESVLIGGDGTGTLHASPDDGAVFEKWSQECSGVATTNCSIRVNQYIEVYVGAAFLEAAETPCAQLDQISQDLDDRKLFLTGQANLALASDAVSEAVADATTDMVCAVMGLFDAPSPFRALPADCSDPGVTCAPGATALTGEIVAVAIDVAEAVPVNDPTWAFQYGFVFETDGDPANDWTPIPQYPNDTFQGTDTWVQFTAPKNGPWSVGVDDVTTTDAIVRRPTSSARVVRDGSTLLMLIPRSELGPSPRVRVTAFRHDGSWLNGQWNIDYYPNTTSPLLPLTAAE